MFVTILHRYLRIIVSANRSRSADSILRQVLFLFHSSFPLLHLHVTGSSTTKYVDKLKQFDGVITPDCSMLINQAQCLQQTNTYFNRAIGFYLQKQGIPVIPNIRWSDIKSFEYCFLGVPKHSIVSISTHGCIRSGAQKEMFKIGLNEMIKQLEPSAVIVHGFMPESVFNDYLDSNLFYRFPSEFEATHIKGE